MTSSESEYIDLPSESDDENSETVSKTLLLQTTINDERQSFSSFVFIYWFLGFSFIITR